MSAPIHSTATAGLPPRLGAALSEVMRVLRAGAQTVDAWRAARRRAAQDREALANMSARQLRDIGIVRWDTDVAVDKASIGDYLR